MVRKDTCRLVIMPSESLTNRSKHDSEITEMVIFPLGTFNFNSTGDSVNAEARDKSALCGFIKYKLLPCHYHIGMVRVQLSLSFTTCYSLRRVRGHGAKKAALHGCVITSGMHAICVARGPLGVK